MRSIPNVFVYEQVPGRHPDVHLLAVLKPLAWSSLGTRSRGFGSHLAHADSTQALRCFVGRVPEGELAIDRPLRVGLSHPSGRRPLAEGRLLFDELGVDGLFPT
jgi:hypothetical protein